MTKAKAAASRPHSTQVAVDSFAKRLLLSALVFERGFSIEARSSGVEHYIDTVGVSGSNPLEPIFYTFQRLILRTPARFI